MAISAQQLTIYLYSAHRAVIFAIAQLSCFPNGWEFLINFLHTCYMILYTLGYTFLFNYFQL